jgi:hypothetical protein
MRSDGAGAGSPAIQLCQQVLGVWDAGVTLGLGHFSHCPWSPPVSSSSLNSKLTHFFLLLPWPLMPARMADLMAKQDSDGGDRAEGHMDVVGSRGAGDHI